MPHSSGGGSHRGGSHGGHRSHSSHGGSHSGGNGIRMSRRPFANSYRYRYRRFGGGYGYIYANREPERISLGSFIFQMVFFIPFIFAGILIASVGFSTGAFGVKALTPKYSDTGNYIEDNIGVIDNYDDLNETLGEFQELTGICPYIITVYDSDWEKYYYSLENYAYDLYVNHFYDEQHFLIVYSEPKTVYENGFVDWSWEGMQGDDTDAIITSNKFSEFQEDLQRYLTMNDYTVGAAFYQAFHNSLGYIMENNHDSNMNVFIIFALLWNFFILIAVCSTISSFVKSRRNYEKVSFSEAGAETTPVNQGFNQINQGANGDVNQGFNQDMSQDVNSGDDNEYEPYRNYDTYPGANNPYSGNKSRGYNLNGNEDGKL